MLRWMSAFVAATAVVFASPAALAAVIVVAPSGGAFTQISAAVAAAAPGDVVLVKAGTYNGFTLGNKSLTVAGDYGAAVTLTGAVKVMNLLAPNVVVLSGLYLPLPSNDPAGGLVISQCSGAVRLQDCELDGYESLVDAATPGARVTQSTQVSFHACVFFGGSGALGLFGPPSPGAPGLHAIDSNLSLWDCLLVGGMGGDGTNAADGARGGDGLLLENSTAMLSATGALGRTGGKGGGAFLGAPSGDGGNGGDGARLLSGSLLRKLEASFAAGAGGQPGSGIPQGVPGSPGQAVALVSGTVTDHGLAHQYDLNSPVRTGQVATHQFTLQNCEQLFLLVSATTQTVWINKFAGTLVAGSPFLQITLSGQCSSGSLTVNTPIPALPAGLLGLNAFCQMFTTGAGGARLGPTRVLTILDASIP